MESNRRVSEDLFAIELPDVLRNLSHISMRVNKSIEAKHKAEFSQYFTESGIAKQMSEMLRIKDGAVIGDHGAGTGMLCSTVLALALSKQRSQCRPFQLHAYEIDGALHRYFGESIDEVSRYAQSLLNASPKVKLSGDFRDVADQLIAGKMTGFLDAAILNPPYQKLNQKSDFAIMLRENLVNCPNLYAAFIALSIEMMKDGAELVTIVPRSFTNGLYFKDFRLWLRKQGSIDWIVRYNNRSNQFRGNNVIQENVTFRFIKGAKQVDRIRISLCDNPSEPPMYESMVPMSDVFPDDSDMILVPSSADELSSLHFMRRMPLSFEERGLQISTGKLEDCRVRDKLSFGPPASGEWAPVVYSQHWARGEVELSWAPEKQSKPSYVAIDSSIVKKLIERGNYVLIKRISANDDRTGRCHPCAITVDSDLPGNLWAIDNHIQVISGIEGRPLTKKDALDLVGYFKEPQIDHVLRVVSGTTQLNKADIQQIRFPLAKLEL